MWTGSPSPRHLRREPPHLRLVETRAETPAEDALRVLARLVAREVVTELRAGDPPEMVDQAASGLGRRRHINWARRLIVAGDRRAVQIGRRYLLTREAVEEARRHYTDETRRPRSEDEEDDAALASELGLAPRTNKPTNKDPDSGLFPKPGRGH